MPAIAADILSALVAHQGGWDEILMVAGPLLVFASVLWLANKRANNRLAEIALVDDSDRDVDSGVDPQADHLTG